VSRREDALARKSAREQKYLAERESIMRAAYRLIGQHASATTSIEDILRATGFARRAFYRHFPSKDALVLALCRRDGNAAAALLRDKVAAARTPRLALAAWVDTGLWVAYDPRRARRGRWYNSIEATSAQGIGDVLEEGYAAQRAPLIELLESGRREGVYPRARPEPDAFAIQALVNRYVERVYLGRPFSEHSEARQAILELFERALGPD
jgi:AcrR family transcriptional regulator